MANYVTFEQAEWLKEKEFNKKCKYAFIVSEFEEVGPYDEDGLELNWNKYKSEIDPKRKFISKPKHYQVVEWLLEEHDIWVEVSRDYAANGKYFYQYFIDKNNQEFGFNSPKEAYSAAFDNIINNNLI